MSSRLLDVLFVMLAVKAALKRTCRLRIARYSSAVVALVLGAAVLSAGAVAAHAADYTLLTQWGSVGSGNGQFHFPNDIAVDASGGVYVTVRDDNDPVTGDRLQKFDSSGNWIWTQTGFNDPEAMAIRNGVVYVAAGSGNAVRTLDAATGAVLNNSWATGYPLNYASGIAFDSAGNCYVGSYYSNAIVKYDPTGAYVTSWANAGAAGVAVDASDNVVAVDYNNAFVNKFTSTGTLIWSKGGGGAGPGQFNQPWGVSIDALGNIYVADSSNNRVQKLDADGTFVSQLGATEGAGFNFPGSVAIDQATAWMYVCDCNNNRIVKYQLPALSVSQGADAGRPTSYVFASASATSVVDEVVMTALGNPSTVDTLTVRGLDSADTLRSDIAGVSIYRDNGDGAFGAGDTQVGKTMAFPADASGSAVVFGGLGSTVTPGTPAAYWIVYAIGASPGNGHDLGSQVLPGDIGVAGTLVLLPSPITSAQDGGTIGIDTDPPTTSLFGASADWSSTPATLTLTATDADSGIAQTYYTINGGLPQLYAAPFVISAEGTTTVAYWSIDNAGNAETPHTSPVRVDTSAPSTPTATASEPSTVTIDVSWTPSTDSVSGVDHYSVYRADGALIATTSATSATSYRVGSLVPATQYGFYVRAFDAAGNFAQSDVTTATTLDAASPVTTLSYPPPNGSAGWWTVAPSVTASASNTAVTYYNFTSVGGPWSIMSGPVTPPEGVSTMYFFSSDGIALPEPTRSVQFKVDTEPPPTPVVNAVAGVNFSVDLSWDDVTDPGSGLAYYRVYQDTGGLVDQTSGTSYHITGLDPGTAYGFVVNAYDIAGNVSTSDVATGTTLSNTTSVEAIPPHVATNQDSDSCAMCHRGHTAASGTQSAADSLGTRSNALLLGASSAQAGDVQLCLSCHGVDTLGSTHDVQSEFLSGPGHVLAPKTSAYGPSPKQCSDCHDSHGSAKTASGTPYPSLLRTKDASTGADVYFGSAYCGACHKPRPGNEFPGLSVWRKTAHASIVAPGSGTRIVCDTCHTPHASPIAPNIVSVIQTPALPATAAVPANDRRFCETCHKASERTWDGVSAYASSAHGSSAATVPVTGEWASSTASRTVGECQVCHDPMGASDGKGGVIPRLAVKAGSALCYTCHDANGPASSNLASIAYAPTAGIESIVAAYGAPVMDQYGRVHLFTRVATNSATIVGPREYVRHGDVGAVAAGDVDGDGTNELLVARAGVGKLDILSNSPFSGLAENPGDVSLLSPADFVGVGDVLGYPTGPPEVVTASGSTVRVYRWNPSTLSLDPVSALSIPTTGTITGMAVGKVVGATRDDVVVTTDSDHLVIMSGSAFALTVSGSYPTRHLPVGPSIGDIDNDGHGEIAVANSGETNPTLSIFSATGAEIWSGGTTTDAPPTATEIGDFLPGVTLPGTSGDEIALVRADPTGIARLDVFTMSGSSGVLDAPSTYALPDHSNPSALAAGDVDGNGKTELVIGSSGYFSADPSLATPPAVSIVRATSAGTGIGSVEQHSGGGVELAGSTSVVVADLGPIGPSRHPVEAATDVHVSTETATVPEHVACVDCHNVHVASTATATAPRVPGVLAGTWGVSVSNNAVGDITLSQKDGVADEYQLCLKCHSTWSALGGSRSVAPDFNTKNASFHPVEGPAPSTNAVGATMEGSLLVGSQIYCIDCHGDASGGEAKGPHRSSAAPLLLAPLAGAQAADTTSLCYRCHRYDVYGSGSADGPTSPRSGFFDHNTSTHVDTALHSFHTTRQVSCSACHVSHGSATLPSLLRGDIGWSATSDGGSCTNACHTTSDHTQSYTRP